MTTTESGVVEIYLNEICTRHLQDRRYSGRRWASTFFIRQTFEGRSPSRWRS